MGYNREDYVRVKAEFAQKYTRARDNAEARKYEIHCQIPQIFDIDRTLSGTGMEIMGIISSGGVDTQKRIAELESRNNALIEKRRELLVKNGYPASYTDVVYECPVCNDSGFVDTKMCTCMRRALIEAGYRSSGLGALIGNQTFDNFEYKYYCAEDGMRSRIEKSVAHLKKFAEEFQTDTYRNFIMIGGTGLGKTHLSTAIAEKVIGRGYDVLYVTATSMLADFEEKRFGSSTGQTAGADVSRYYDCDLLIIDDLGTEVVNKFTQSYFYEVINTRINSRKSTVINTNLSPSEISNLYTERISSRILGEYLPIQFCGVDIRKQKSLGH